ncbi:hypothetical protein [Dysgonomonas macrotermitis]|uniref:Uncharacterized protein n=1 Tax=Dysgonomonas macrotermitis TaxID=1346286 RepID=A0A1M5C5F7_9BACT|nr:hypothetical protein [Dysgonomonas macrotermitis]SHF49993.1 hypothetical protein SAMN05444362_10738 [Dysgonomonas macrotermitis]
MGTVKQIRDRYSDAIKGVHEVTKKVADSNKDVLLSLNRDQMLLGRNKAGETFTPGYLNDPYFKTPARAQAYKKMKQGLEQQHSSRMRFSNVQLYPDKNSDTPNLIVTGPFQDSMFITVSASDYSIGSTYVDASDINAKYNNAVFGLAPKSKAFFYRNWIHPAIIKYIKEKLKKK